MAIPFNESNKNDRAADDNERVEGFFRLIAGLRIENQAGNSKQYPADKENGEPSWHGNSYCTLPFERRAGPLCVWRTDQGIRLGFEVASRKTV